MWEHALGIRLCQGFPVGVCHLPLCLVLTVPDITASDTHTHTHFVYYQLLYSFTAAAAAAAATAVVVALNFEEEAISH